MPKKIKKNKKNIGINISFIINLIEIVNLNYFIYRL